MRRGLRRRATIVARSAEWVGRARNLTVRTSLIELSADGMYRVVSSRLPYACQCRRPIGPRRRPACRVVQEWSRWYRDPTALVEALDMDTRSSGQSATDLTSQDGAPAVSSSGAISHAEAQGFNMVASCLSKEASCDRLSKEEDEEQSYAGGSQCSAGSVPAEYPLACWLSYERLYISEPSPARS